MKEQSVPLTEKVVVGLTVIGVALLYRHAWLPHDPAAALERAADIWGLPVSEAGRWFSAWTLGDGQAFAVIASDPLGLEEGWQVKQPAYRYSRAGFGWLAWVASLGQARWVPYGMAIVGGLAVAGALILATRLRSILGTRAWLIVLNPALFIGFAGDTAEPLAILFLTWALGSGTSWAAVALAVTRPSYLVALFGRWRQVAFGAVVASVLNALWLLRFGFEPGQYGGALTFPILGYAEAPSVQAVLLALLALATALIGLRHRNWAWVVTGLFVLSFSEAVVSEVVNGWRAAGMLFVLLAFGPSYGTPALSHLLGVGPRFSRRLRSLAGSGQ